MHRFWNSPGQQKFLSLASCALLSAGVLAGCGGASTGAGSAATARTLLRETFTGSHPINSGVLQASLSVDPTGSSVLTRPLTLSFGGPFQSRGKGQLPESDFDIAIGFEGHTGRLGILSTGTQGFVILEASAYRLPAADFKQLESGVSSVGGGSGASSTLSGLGIHPQNWLIEPRVVGRAQVGGTQTDHIHGTLALRPLLADLSKLLGEASTVSSSTSALKPLSAATQAKIAGEVRGASFDLWTSTRSHTIAKLSVTAGLPVSGTTRTELGGMTSARFTFGLAYSDVGQPQHITTPSSSAPFSQFQTRLRTIVLEIEQLVVGASSSSTSGTSGTTTTPTSGSASGGDSAYSTCVAAAGGSVPKLQKCASLLNGTG